MIMNVVSMYQKTLYKAFVASKGGIFVLYAVLK